jgi:hypothetical protein
VLAQAAHSTEEYLLRLYEDFAPARFVSSLISTDVARGFLIANATLVGFGIWCWAFPLRRRWRIAGAVAWFWVVLEIANGLGHIGMALSRGGYMAGAATAPLVIAAAVWLGVRMTRESG